MLEHDALGGVRQAHVLHSAGELGRFVFGGGPPTLEEDSHSLGKTAAVRRGAGEHSRVVGAGVEFGEGSVVGGGCRALLVGGGGLGGGRGSRDGGGREAGDALAGSQLLSRSDGSDRLADHVGDARRGGSPGKLTRSTFPGAVSMLDGKLGSSSTNLVDGELESQDASSRNSQYQIRSDVVIEGTYELNKRQSLALSTSSAPLR